MKDIVHFVNLSRPLNVLITLLAFGLSAFISLGKAWTFLDDPQFWYAGICLLLIAATGYWVNDAFDFKIDRINKPRRTIVNAHLSVKKVLTAYFTVVVLVLVFSLLVQTLALFALNVAAVALLFAYAALLKRTTVVGNIVIAALTGLVIYYAAVLYVPRSALMWTILFAFEVTFIREVVKDIEDIAGDLAFRLQTLPIRIGIHGTKKVLYWSYAVFVLSCYGPVAEGLLRFGTLNWPYLLVSVLCVQVPAVYLAVRLRTAADPGDFGWQSSSLKALIFLGMISILFLR